MDVDQRDQYACFLLGRTFSSSVFTQGPSRMPQPASWHREIPGGRHELPKIKDVQAKPALRPLGALGPPLTATVYAVIDSRVRWNSRVIKHFEEELSRSGRL